MDSIKILWEVYRIQGLSDPNQPATDLAERIAEIYELACSVMEQTGFDPN